MKPHLHEEYHISLAGDRDTFAAYRSDDLVNADHYI
jgi:hypothetical protein